ncbi:MAG: Gfo/Idh/MocA family oxidoreductase [Armatimonadota bacterium]|nr:Gfo/Idh/MocA family oxidoreductase [Armatimonadota bacterium]
MAGEEIGIATLGAGGIAGAHLKALAHIPEGRFVAAADTDLERARARVREFGGARAFASFQEAIACPGVDAVIVCLPHALHREAVLAAAAAGKHILVEKPMATNLCDATAMVEAAEAAGVVLMVGQVLRFRESNRVARQLIREGKIGRVRNILRRRTSWFKDWVPWARDPALCGGIALYGFGSHEVDMMLWLADSLPTRVYADGEKVNPVWQDYDEVTLQLRLSCGAMGSLCLSLNNHRRTWECVVVGEEGTLVPETHYVEWNGQRLDAPMAPDGGMGAQLREFLAAIREKRAPEASGRQVRDTTMVALEAARLSLQRRQPVDAAAVGS